MDRNSFCSPSIGHWILGSLPIWLGNFVAQNRECEISSNNQLIISYFYLTIHLIMLQYMYVPLFMISINNPSQAVKMLNHETVQFYFVSHHHLCQILSPSMFLFKHVNNSCHLCAYTLKHCKFYQLWSVPGLLLTM